ncbi:MAG TPA: helix-turn-helix domain-containing protein [Solirubrobacteraceae bacterium]|nr:helix-turn-helix domain-containing protein [Solirubrobacteraceae bacterium]
METRSWAAEALPSEAVSVVRAEVGALVNGVVAAVRAENPVYADVLGGPEGIGIRLGIEQAIRAFLDAVERGERPTGETAEVWRRLGEVEFQSGRGLEALRAAFRTGTRAAWRGAADLAAEAGITASLVISLAEAIFVYSDELASDVVEGYLRVQSDEAGERERRRRRLAALLLDPAGHDPEALERAASLARWPLPRALAVLAIAADSPAALSRQLAVDALAGADAEGAWLIVPDADGPGRGGVLRSAAAAAGVASALGPTVGVHEAPRSLRWARSTLTLVQRGAIPPGAPARAADHLATLIVLHDHELSEALAARRLAPFDNLTELERARLLETLQAWLDHQRHTPDIAAALHVHPQTVRYRVRQLHELLGDALDTPEGRFELALALRARGG